MSSFGLFICGFAYDDPGNSPQESLAGAIAIFSSFAIQGIIPLLLISIGLKKRKRFKEKLNTNEKEDDH